MVLGYLFEQTFFMDYLDTARFATAARRKGWRIERTDDEGVVIARRPGLSTSWVRIGILLIPTGIGLIILLVHLISKKMGRTEQRRITTSEIESGFFPPLLR